jgi:hypothetical protein
MMTDVGGWAGSPEIPSPPPPLPCAGEGGAKRRVRELRRVRVVRVKSVWRLLSVRSLAPNPDNGMGQPGYVLVP